MKRLIIIAGFAAAIAGAAIAQTAPPAPAATADDVAVLKDQLQITEQQRNQAQSDFAAQRAQMVRLARAFNDLQAEDTKKDAKIKELEAKLPPPAAAANPVSPPATASPDTADKPK